MRSHSWFVLYVLFIAGSVHTVLQIKRGYRDHLGIFHLQHICCDPSLEPSPRDGSYDWSQHVFDEK